MVTLYGLPSDGLDCYLLLCLLMVAFEHVAELARAYLLLQDVIVDYFGHL